MHRKLTLICDGCGAEYPDDQNEELLLHERTCLHKVQVWVVEVKFETGYKPEVRVACISTWYPLDKLAKLAINRPKVDSSPDEMYWVQCTTDKSKVPELEKKLRQMAHDNIMKYADAALNAQMSEGTETDHQ